MVYRKQQRERVVRDGFTLMEILVVVSIILILAGVGGYYLMGQVSESRKSRAKMDVRTLTTACEMYAKDHFETFPPSLDALCQKDANGKGPYLKSQESLYDPWGNRYQYNQQGSLNGGTQPDIWSESQYGKIGNWSGASGASQ
jgi:general secretion pathway protein G